MIYYIVLFIILVFLAYIMGITIVTIIDKHLGNIAINLPKQNIILNLPHDKIKNFTNQNLKNNSNNEYDNNNENSIKHNDEFNSNENLVEGFHNNYEKNYILNNVIPNAEIPTACFENHSHNKCLHGEMNYIDPNFMSPLDQRYFKYNYQPNLTLQDYVNWLWLYNDSSDELPYIHMKNLYKLRKDKKLKYKKDIIPPKSKILIPKTSEEYYNKIYSSGIMNTPLQNSKNDYEAYNYNQYPNYINSNLK